MDDEIIHSWCFNSVECFDSTPSAAIIILVKDLESFSSLRSQQLVDRDIIMRIFLKNVYQVSINRRRRITTQGARVSLVGILFFLLFLSW